MKPTIPLLLTLTVLPAAANAQAVQGQVQVQGQANVQIGQPVQAQPQPVYVQPQPQPQPVYVQPQPVYVQPQPVYMQPQPQPVYVQPQPVYMQPAATVYTPRPARRGRSLLIAGSITLGVPYLLSLFAGVIMLGFSNANDRAVGGVLLIPVAGPFIGAAIASAGAGGGSGVAVLVLDGLIQAGGLTMLIIGGVMRASDRSAANEHSRAPRWAVTPFGTGNGGAGLALSVVHF